MTEAEDFEKIPGLITEFVKVSDVELLNRFDQATTLNKGDMVEKTHMLLEILIRMGSFEILSKVSEQHIADLKKKIHAVVTDLNDYQAQGKLKALDYWRPVAERLGRRLVMAEAVFAGNKTKEFGEEVHEGTSGEDEERYGS